MTYDDEHLSYVNLPSVYLCEMSIEVFCPLLAGLLIFFLSFKNPFYILDKSPLSNKSFANVFS